MYVGTNQHRRRHQMRDIFVRCPSVPKAEAPVPRLFAMASTNVIAFPILGPPHQLLVLSFGQVEVAMESVADTQPLMLNSAEAERDLF